MIDLAAYNLAPEKSLLVINDMQNEFCKPGGSRYSPANEACIPPIKSLLDQARKQEVPIIFIRTVRTREEAAVKIWGYEHMLDEGTWNTQIVNEIFPGEVNEFVVTKHSHDPFFQTDLDDILRKIAPKPTEYYAVVTGVTSNIAFLEAVDGFHVRDYWTIAPIDCTAGPEDIHEETVKKLEAWSLWNVFPSRSDLITFGPPGSETGLVINRDGPGLIMHR